ncbi:MAG: zinc-binding dehydrogenase, partial [Cyanobacteria bacterium J06636_16]
PTRSCRSPCHFPVVRGQHKLLNRVSALLDDGTLLPTVNNRGGTLNAENLRAAHELQESGKAIGKTVLDGLTAE